MNNTQAEGNEMNQVTNQVMNQTMNKSGISKVIYYTAAPAETCDRCSTGIKNVYVIVYRDGFRAKFGSECIRKMLSEAPNMWTLFTKNSKLLAKYQDYLSILGGPVGNMQWGTEYYGSGQYFIADSKGKDIFCDGRWYFHPVYDVQKNQGGRQYVIRDVVERERKVKREIEKALAFLQAEVERLEVFLGRVVAKAQATTATATATVRG